MSEVKVRLVNGHIMIEGEAIIPLETLKGITRIDSCITDGLPSLPPELALKKAFIEAEKAIPTEDEEEVHGVLIEYGGSSHVIFCASEEDAKEYINTIARAIEYK